MTRWNWTASAEETRKALFGRNYVKPKDRCDHLPEVRSEQTREYRCKCGKVAISEMAMVDCSSTQEFFSLMQSLIAEAYHSEGMHACAVCSMWHPPMVECPNQPLTPSGQLVEQLMERVKKGEVSRSRAAQVLKMSIVEMEQRFEQIQLERFQRMVTNPPPMRPKPQPVVVAVEKGFRKIDLDDD